MKVYVVSAIAYNGFKSVEGVYSTSELASERVNDLDWGDNEVCWVAFEEIEVDE